MPLAAIAPHIHVPYEKIRDYIPFILQNNLNLELYFSAAALDAINTGHLLRLQETLSYKPELSFHAPFMDLSPGAVDSKVRKATLERFNQVLDVAEILKPKCIVFHSGYEKWKYALKTDLWLEKSLETWLPLNQRAEELGITLAIENIFEDEPTNLKLLMENMNSQNFGICFDTGHCNLFSKVSLEKWLTDLKSHIVELHLHDNDKSADLHHPIGEGNFDFSILFAILKANNCIYTIEAHTPERVLKSIEALKKHTENF